METSYREKAQSAYPLATPNCLHVFPDAIFLDENGTVGGEIGTYEIRQSIKNS